jgi:hypothetical protein
MSIEPVSGKKPWDLQKALDSINSSLTPGYQLDLPQLDPAVATVASINRMNAKITIIGMEFELSKQASNQFSQGCNKLIFSNG